MKKSHLLGALCAAIFGLCVVASAEAIMINRDGGAAAYDTILDITWTTDASLSGYANWYELVAWADSLEYLGFDDWRLASLNVRTSRMHINCRYATELACRDNELGYMFYHNLGGSYKDNLTGDRTIGDVTLTNIQNGYWSSTEIDDNGAWGFWFNLGVQLHSVFQSQRPLWLGCARWRCRA